MPEIKKEVVCDFCQAKPVTWAYPCTDFVLEVIGYKNIGEWAACENCHALIEQGNKTMLLAKSVATHPLLTRQSDPETLEFVLAQVYLLHEGFFGHRTGDPFPASRTNHESNLVTACEHCNKSRHPIYQIMHRIWGRVGMDYIAKVGDKLVTRHLSLITFPRF